MIRRATAAAAILATLTVGATGCAMPSLTSTDGTRTATTPTDGSTNSPGPSSEPSSAAAPGDATAASASGDPTAVDGESSSGQDREQSSEREALQGRQDLWDSQQFATVTIPSPMREITSETFGPVAAAAFNAGTKPRPRGIAGWIQRNNDDITWASTEPDVGVWRLVGTRARERAPVQIDIRSTIAGTIVRVVDPGLR